MKTLNVLTNAARAVGVALLLQVPAQAQTEWRFNNSYPASRPESAQIRTFAADVEKRTGGKLKISVSEGGALGLKDADAMRFMQTGTPELGYIWPPFLGRDAPALANIYVYGLVANADEHLKALPALKSVLKEGIAKWNVEVPGFLGFSIVDAALFCREPVKTLEELKKKKLRVGSREQVETFKRLGVAAQIVPQNELYAAMQTGVVDCALYAPRFANSISLQEVAKHVTPTGFPFPPAPYALLAHKAKWAALPADLKKGFLDAVTELERVSFNFDADTATEAASRDKLQSQGVTYHPALPAADKAAIRRSALETWDVLAKETGADAIAYRQKVLDALPEMMAQPSLSPAPWVAALERLWRGLALMLAMVGAGALAGIFVLVLGAVVMRYGWGRPLALTEELSGLLMTVAVFALLPITVLNELNIRVSLASERLPPRPKRLLFVLGQFVLLAFAVVFVQQAWAISAFTAQLKLMSEQSRLPLAPFLWLATGSMALTGAIALWRAWQPHAGDASPEVMV